MAPVRGVLCALLAVFCAFYVRYCEGIRTWAPRCCRKGMHKAVISKGNPDVCNRDDLDRRSQFSPMERMICRWSERLCCMKEIQKLSCEHGKYNAFQGKTCMPRRPLVGGDHYVECCDCCKLGIKARTTKTNCSAFNTLLLKSFTNPCERVFIECCSGKTIRPPSVPLPTGFTTFATNPAKVRGCAQKKCQHICRENSDGLPMCYCRLGYSLTGDQETCVDVNECLRSPCSPAQRCENTPGSHRCVQSGPDPTRPNVCGPGLELRNGICQDINECNSKRASCGPEQRCRNTRGSYRCICKNGYRAVGRNCVDIDECKRGIAGCPPGQTCTNRPGSYFCSAPGSCPPGKKKENGGCVDIDECTTGQYRCPSVARCVNTDGSYRCVPCESGTRVQNNKCTDIDECATPNACPGGARCINTYGSFRCAKYRCGSGQTYQAGRGCVDINECATRQARCQANSYCVNTLGSYRCVPCPSGTRAKAGSCEDIDECKEGRNNCGRDQTCQNTYGSYRCDAKGIKCGKGYKPSNGNCVDIDECNEGGAICRPGQTCVNLRGSYQCNPAKPCQRGFRRGSDGLCKDIDECTEGIARCPRGKDCHNTYGSYKCWAKRITCRKGYEILNGICVDINECRTLPRACPRGQNCVNTAGSYSCLPITCSSGFEFRDNRCQDIDECATRRTRCTADQYCVNSVGSYQCKSCGRGYRYRNGKCQDIDECRERLANCRSPQVCRNTQGGYRCEIRRVTCRQGYEFVEGKCQDINECIGANNVCRAGTMCLNNMGGYRCVVIPCPSGYIRARDGKCKSNNPCSSERFRCPDNFRCVIKNGRPSCEDINECLEKPNACFRGETCINKPGHYTCKCPAGYRRDVTKRCVDRDECVEGAYPCQQSCTNTQGTYKCSCRRGFKLQSDGRTCRDVDECAQKLCQHKCKNLFGSYQCFCNPGFVLAADRRSCDDVDECAGQANSYPGYRPCQYRCRNKPGSYECRCPQGYELKNGRNCYDVNECVRTPGICRSRDTVCRNTYGYHRCIPFSCGRYYKKEGDNGCKLVDDCSEIDECKVIKDKGRRFYTFAIRNGEGRKKLFDYSLWTRGYDDPVRIEYGFISGNNKGHFEIRKLNMNQVEIWTTITMSQEAEYVLEFYGAVYTLPTGKPKKLESRYTITLYVFVSRYTF